MQVSKYELGIKTRKMTLFSKLEGRKFLLQTAKIGYENTYDMRAKIQCVVFATHAKKQV